jgi:Tfp pilus assembly protein PilN
MSLSLNLLPPELKSEIKTKKRLGRLLHWGTWAAILLGGFIGSLVVGNIWLRITVSGQERNIKASEESLKRFATIEKDVLTIGERVGSLSKAEKERALWSKVVADLASETPGGIRISSVILNVKSDVEVKVSGSSTTKSDVALFRDRLEASNRFSKVSIESVGATASGGKVETTFSIVGSLESLQ